MKAYERIHPAASSVYFLLLLLITMFISHPVIHAVSLAGGLVFQFSLLSKRSVAKSLLFYLIVFIAVTATNPLISQLGSTRLFTVFGIGYTFEAVLYGMDMAVMLIAVMVWCVDMSRVITPEKAAYLFSRRLPKTALLLTMTMRYIPLLRRRWNEIRRAQRASGGLSGKTAIERVKAHLRAFSILIGWSLENAIDTSRSMKARGYGKAKRTAYSIYSFRPGDAAFLAAVCVLFAAVVAGSVGGYTTVSYYPTVSGISAAPLAVISYVSFSALSLMPFILESKEALIWKYYLSRI